MIKLSHTYIQLHLFFRTIAFSWTQIHGHPMRKLSYHIQKAGSHFPKEFHHYRPLALRGHVTNASFKQWVGILLMPKIVRAHKNYLTPEIWEETHLREIFYGTLIFQQSSMICIGRHVGGHAFALQHGGQNYFLLISSSMFHSYTQMCCKRYHIIFSTFSLKFKCKICVQREVIHNFKNHILVTWPFTNLFILRKWCGFEKPNHYYFV